MKQLTTLIFLVMLPVMAWALPPTPVAEFSFENISGNFLADLSPDQNNGQISGAVQAAGRNGAGLQFDGNDFVEIDFSPSLVLSTQVSLEAWVFPTAFTSSWQALITSANYAYYLYTNDSSQGSLGGVFTSTYVEAINSNALPLNTWSHMAMTYDGNSINYYVNGIEVARQNATGTIRPLSGSLFIGGLGAGEGFIGSLDNVRIYDAALSPADVLQNMQTVPGIPPTPDIEPPTVNIFNLAQNSTVSGINTFTAVASDDTAVASVEFFLDNISLATADITPPYEVSFNSRTQVNGQYSLTAVATDFSGNTSVSSAFFINIENNAQNQTGAMSFTVNEANPSPNELRYDYGLQTVIPAGFGEGEFTFELWVKPDNSFPFGPTFNGDGQRINWTSEPADPQPSDGGGWWYKGNFLLDGHANSSDGRGTFSLQVYGSGRVRWHFYDSAAEWGIQAANVESSPNIVDGNWHQITLVRRWVGEANAALELWVDGNQVGQVISSARDNMRAYWDTWANFLPRNEGWFWGVEKLTAVGDFYQYEDYKGLIDEVRYWSRAKTTAELTNNYQDAVTGAEPNLVGLYQFSMGQANQNCNVLVADPAGCIDFINVNPGVISVENAPVGGTSTIPQQPDTQDPEVTLINPVTSSILTGTISLSADATDNISVAGVQFQINGGNYAAEILSAPYQLDLDTTTFANGVYSLSAIARDTSGNLGASQAIVVSINNIQTSPDVTSVVDFDNPELSTNPEGTFQGIDFGSGRWAVSGAYGANSTNHIYFRNDVVSQNFSFTNGARVLTSVSIYALGSQSQTIVVSDNNGQTVSWVLAEGDGLLTLLTNWELPSTTITFSSSSGWAFGLDEIGYR